MNIMTQTTAPQLVAHSVLNADALAAEIAERYEIEGPVRVQLLFRGMNDVYVVHDGSRRRALRVWRGTWRRMDEVRNELAFLNFLRDRDFPASFPVPLKNGDWHFVLQAPEAERAVALYEWAPGTKVFDNHTPEIAREVGHLLGRMHVIGADYTPVADIDLKGGNLLRDLPNLVDLVGDRPDDVRDYTAFAPIVQKAIDGLAQYDLPQGNCHGDLHPSNAHVTADGSLTLLDFDGCGRGYFLKDIANYVFGSNFYGFPPELGEAFVEGYCEVRPMTQDERRLLKFFVFLKTFQLVAGIARNVNSVGRASLRFRGLDWFASEVRQGMKDHAEFLGIAD